MKWQDKLRAFIGRISDEDVTEEEMRSFMAEVQETGDDDGQAHLLLLAEMKAMDVKASHPTPPVWQ